MVAIISLVTTFVLAAAVNAQLPPTIPDACKSDCKPILDKLTANTAACVSDPDCFCSNDVIKGLNDCYKCAGDKVDKKAVADNLKLYVDGCKSIGITVDINAITGSSGSGSSGSSGSSGGSSSATPTGTGNNGGNSGKSGDASSLQMSGFAAVVALGGLALF